MTGRNKRNIQLGPDEPDDPRPSESAGKVAAHRQVRTMTLVAFARLNRGKISLRPEDLKATGDAVAGLCLTLGVRPTEIDDHRFGKIRLFPEWVLNKYFGIKG